MSESEFSEFGEFRKRTSRLLQAFVYDYLKKTGYNETAKTYFKEVQLNNWPPTWLEQLIVPNSQISPDLVIPDSMINANVSVHLDDTVNENSNILVSSPNIITATSSPHPTSPINVNSPSQTPPLVILQPSDLQILDNIDTIDLQACGSPKDGIISVKLEEIISSSSIIIPEIKSEPGVHEENLRDLFLPLSNSHERMSPPKDSRESIIECESEVNEDQLPDLKLPLEGQDGFLQDWWIILWENYKTVYERKTGKPLEHYGS